MHSNTRSTASEAAASWPAPGGSIRTAAHPCGTRNAPDHCGPVLPERGP
jgi:hypothetical protein